MYKQTVAQSELSTTEALGVGWRSQEWKDHYSVGGGTTNNKTLQHLCSDVGEQAGRSEIEGMHHHFAPTTATAPTSLRQVNG